MKTVTIKYNSCDMQQITEIEDEQQTVVCPFCGQDSTFEIIDVQPE